MDSSSAYSIEGQLDVAGVHKRLKIFKIRFDPESWHSLSLTMNYKELLKTYIRHVHFCGSDSFLGPSYKNSTVELLTPVGEVKVTPEEWRELQNLRRELEVY